MPQRPADAGGRVDEEPRRGLGGAGRMGLDQIVERDPRLLEIVDQVAQPLTQRLRQHRGIGASGRAEDPVVEAAMDRIEATIEAFERIIGSGGASRRGCNEKHGGG